MDDQIYYIEVKAYRLATGTTITEWVRVPRYLPTGEPSDMDYTLSAIVNMVLREQGPGWEANAIIKNHSEWEAYEHLRN
jgi:hypothetical protein